MSVEFDRGSPGKFDSRTLSRKTLSRWTGRIGSGMHGEGWKRVQHRCHILLLLLLLSLSLLLQLLSLSLLLLLLVSLSSLLSLSQLLLVTKGTIAMGASRKAQLV